MSLILKSIFLVVSVVGFVDIMAINDTSIKEVSISQNTRPMLTDYINSMKNDDKISFLEEKYAFNLISCENIIKNTLPFQEDYKGCADNIILANSYLVSQ